MKKLILFFEAILIIGFLFTNCENNFYNKGVNDKEKNNIKTEKEDEKPKLCDCQNEFWRLSQIAIDTHDGDVYSKFIDECEKYYSVEQTINAVCGLKEYDPNFKAK